MQTTISLKIPQDLAFKLKKTSKNRGVSMSDLVRSAIESIFTKTASPEKEPEIFKYFGIFEEDDKQYKEFQENLEKRKTGYKSRRIES